MRGESRPRCMLVRDLTPAAVAAEACRLVLDHLGRVGFALAPAVDVRLVSQVGAEPRPLTSSHGWCTRRGSR